MRCLIVEGEFHSRFILGKYLGAIGEVYFAEDGLVASFAVHHSLTQGTPYDLVTLDVMTPELQAVKTLKTIRKIEEEHGLDPSQRVKILLTTTMEKSRTVMRVLNDQCDGYLNKPLHQAQLSHYLETIS